MNPGYTVENINDYANRLTEEQKKLFIRHCNRYRVKPVICAWYDDMDDFYSDWCDVVGFTKTEARQRLKEGKRIGEFKIFSDNQIIRVSI